jgi:hypothetical protein
MLEGTEALDIFSGMKMKHQKKLNKEDHKRIKKKKLQKPCT